MIPLNTLCRLQMVSFNKNMKYAVLALKIVSLIRDNSGIKGNTHSQITKIVSAACYDYCTRFIFLSRMRFANAKPARRSIFESLPPNLD